ncbi:hypothetical protein HDU98_010231 [Podochytrium sp. JEL0797]|nr:hypothetical protein HDU98_010231 [Podochytrium sp. JEL0797]
MASTAAAPRVTFAFRRSRTAAIDGKRAFEVLRSTTNDHGEEQLDPSPVYLIHQTDFSVSTPFTLANFRIQSAQDPDAMLDFEPYGFSLGFIVRDKESKTLDSYQVNAMRTLSAISDVTIAGKTLTWHEHEAECIAFSEVKKHYAKIANAPFQDPLVSPHSILPDYKTSVALDVHRTTPKNLDRVIYRLDADQPVGFGPPPPSDPLPFHAMGIKLDPKKKLRIKEHENFKVSSVLHLVASGILVAGVVAAAKPVLAVATADRMALYRGKQWQEVDLFDGIGGVESNGEFPVFGRVCFHTEEPDFAALGVKVDGSACLEMMALLGALVAGWQSDVVNPRAPFKLRNKEIVEERVKHGFWMAVTGCEIM